MAVRREGGIQGTQVSLLSVASLLSLWLLMEGEGKPGKSAEDALEKTKEIWKTYVSVYLFLSYRGKQGTPKL